MSRRLGGPGRLSYPARWRSPASAPGRRSPATRRARRCAATRSPSRRACARYAREFGEDEELWRATALLHDFDYEIHPTLDKHPQDGAPILREEGYPEELIEAVLSHAEHLEHAARHAAQEDALRLRRAGRLRPRLRARAAGRDRDARAEVGEEEAQAAVLRRRRAPRRGLRGRRAARPRARRAHPERDRARCARSRPELGLRTVAA